jgi:hypothetical protein
MYNVYEKQINKHLPKGGKEGNMYIVKYDFCHDDGTREYGLEEKFTNYENARKYREDCKEDERCCNIQLIDLSGC